VKPVVVIHTNDQQMLAARVHAHSLKSRSATPDLFDVRLLRLEETPELLAREGQRYVWWHGNTPETWRRRDLQSFAFLRRKVPEEQGFSGRALLLDPDITAIGDVYELLVRDLKGKAIGCTAKPGELDGRPFNSTAVMLFDCDKLRHWDWANDLEEIFARRLETGMWMSLLDEDPELIGRIEPEWNSLDSLTNDTKLLHNTERSMQPWKTGLRADFDQPAPRGPAAMQWLRGSAVPHVIRRPGGARYGQHHDPAQERIFFTLLKECVELARSPLVRCATRCGRATSARTRWTSSSA
jgi:hypothetical protein